MTTDERHIPLEGAYNVRDVGGYLTHDGPSTQWKRFLRADSLGTLTEAAQQQLLDYGLRTMIDLRSDNEVTAEPNVFAESDAITYYNIPIFAASASVVLEQMPRDLLTIYKYILDDAQSQVLQVMTALAEPDAFPALVHCTAGKDRTGVITALLLDLVGVDDETIAADYQLTTIYLKPKLDKIREQAAAAGRDMISFEPLLLSEAETMLATLRYLDEVHGGAEAYLHHIGLSSQQTAQLKQGLIAE